MPKFKSRKAASKRFRVTGTGKIMRRKANRSHLLEHKKTVRKRRLAKATQVAEVEAESVRLMLPYLK